MEILAKSRSDRGQKVKKVIFNIIQIGRVTTLKNTKNSHDSKTVSILQIGWLVFEILAKTDFRRRGGWDYIHHLPSHLSLQPRHLPPFPSHFSHLPSHIPHITATYHPTTATSHTSPVTSITSPTTSYPCPATSHRSPTTSPQPHLTTL